MIVLCGNFAKNDMSVVNGQVTKTRNILSILQKLPNERIVTIDTSKGKIGLFLSIIKYYFKCDQFLLCVSRNGTRLITPLLYLLKKLKKNVRIIFFCVGTCPLPQNYLLDLSLSRKDKKIGIKLKSFNYVCAETKVLKTELEKVYGLNNVVIFKNYQIGKNIVDIQHNDNGKFVYFSRICYEKNVDGLFKALDELKIKYNIEIKVDFYGPISSDIKDYFNKEIDNRINCTYKGIVESSKAIDILKDYKALLFPTRHLGEGTPGAIVDAAFANLPVIAQQFWASDELIVESYIGIVDKDISKNICIFISTRQDEIMIMKNNCRIFAKSYGEKEAIDIIGFLLANDSCYTK